MNGKLVVTSVVDAVTDDLKAQILAAEFRPGDAFTEADIAARYGIARPTAKAAIERLVNEKALVRGSRQTAQVAEIGPEDVRDIYRTRTFLESQVLRQLAAQRIVPKQANRANAEIAACWREGSWDTVDPDMRFHTALVDAVHTPRLSAMYRSLAFEVKLCMAHLRGSQRMSPEVIYHDHAHILELIQAGEPDAVAAMIDEHLARARELLVGALGGDPGPEASRPPSYAVSVP